MAKSESELYARALGVLRKRRERGSEDDGRRTRLPHRETCQTEHFRPWQDNLLYTVTGYAIDLLRSDDEYIPWSAEMKVSDFHNKIADKTAMWTHRYHYGGFEPIG